MAHRNEEGSQARELGKRKRRVQDEAVEESTQNLVGNIKVRILRPMQSLLRALGENKFIFTFENGNFLQIYQEYFQIRVCW